MYIVLIPAYQPDDTLVELVKALLGTIADRQAPKVIVVDDGSTTDASKIAFESLARLPEVCLLKHSENLGKGAALKTGFGYVLESLPTVGVVVTADADGQHLPEDILAVGSKALEEDRPILGVRSFDANVPARSKLGNTLTRRLFSAVFGVDVSDTQTGLRAIPRTNLSKLLAIPYNRYNYEFEALIRLVKDRKLAQYPIATVYQPGNPSSHFNPLLDSARIYAVFARHLSFVF